MPLTLAATTPGEPEIFASIQGEGVSAGRPSTFIRLSRCNLACTWCDTPYTWHFTGDNRPHSDGVTYDHAENQVVLEEAEAAARIAALGGNRLVITGGEPLMQASALARLFAALETVHPMYIEVETNGTIAPPASLLEWVHQYNVSPKLAHSGNPTDLALRPDPLKAFAEDRRAFFKFVIAEPADVDEVLAVAEAHSIPRERVFLMPEGRDSATLHARMRWLAQICTTHGFTLTDRLHIHLYGDTRGT
jgi:7-carboxy-7-deazaguanine synthase